MVLIGTIEDVVDKEVQRYHFVPMIHEIGSCGEIEQGIGGCCGFRTISGMEMILFQIAVHLDTGIGVVHYLPITNKVVSEC